MGRENDTGLRFGPVGSSAMHLCVDMQRMFLEDTAWRLAWGPRVVPRIEALLREGRWRTVFTRFVPAQSPGEGQGVWRRYYEKWASMTLANLPAHMVDVAPALRAAAPDARVFDKTVYSPWLDGALHADLQLLWVDTLIVTGGETDVCVLASVSGAIDLGYRVIVVSDALCSSSDQMHDALLRLYQCRYSEQVETVSVEDLLAQG